MTADEDKKRAEQGRGKPVPSTYYDERYYWMQDGPSGWQRFRETGGQWRAPGGSYLQSLAELEDGMNVLDVGCGRGEFVFRCARDHRAVSVGVDYSAAAVQIARGIVYEFGTEEQKERMFFVRADAEQMPFVSGFFDVIVSHHVVEHLYPEQLERMLGECNRLLRDNGRLVLETGPNLWRLRYGFPITRLIYRLPFLGEIYRRMMGVEEIPQQARTAEDARYHVGEQSVRSLKRALVRNGFESKVWIGLSQDDRLTKEAFRKRFRKTGALLWSLYRVLYGVFPCNLIFGDIIYALAWPDRRENVAHRPSPPLGK